MADLKGSQLKDSYQNLLTKSASNRVEDGDGTALNPIRFNDEVQQNGVRYKRYVGNIPEIGGSESARFIFTCANSRSVFIKISISQSSTGSGSSNNDCAAEYAFRLHALSGAISILDATTIFESQYSRATHFSFTNLGSNQGAIDLANPTSSSLTLNSNTYKVEILNPGTQTESLVSVTVV